MGDGLVARKKVIVEYRLSKSKRLAIASSEAMLEIEDTGFKLDHTFKPIPVNPEKKMVTSLFDANETSVLIRGEIDESKEKELKSKPNVIEVWTDAEIAPTIDCNITEPKGDLKEVAEHLRVDEIWNDTRGNGIVIGICDMGVRKEEIPEVSEDGYSPWWFLPQGETLAGKNHGNMCATDALGMCPEAQIYDIGVLKANRQSERIISNALAGFQWAIEKHKIDKTPHILSNSWSIFKKSDAEDYATNPNHPFTRKVIEAIQEGIIVCFSAGNCGEFCPDPLCGPDTGSGKSIWGANGHCDVITVGAVNINEELMGFSSQGPAALCDKKPDFCGISNFRGYLEVDTGTSAACPIVAGVTGLLKSTDQTLTQGKMKELLQETAKDKTGNGFDYKFGYGIIQPKVAFDKIRDGEKPCIDLKNFDILLQRSEPTIFSQEDSEKIDYDTKEKALSIVYDGYTVLPKLYHEVFVDPLRDLIVTEDYNLICRAFGDGPLEDWLASINQRTKGYLKDATHAFEEIVADLYDGFLSMEERRGIKPPDYGTVSPLVKWGRPEYGPYTWPSETGKSIGMKMAVVNMPPSFSKNILLWSVIGHETGGHDILHADKGLLKEIGLKVSEAIMKKKDDPALKNKYAIVNNRSMSLAYLASIYWKYTIDEAASDVCSLLNLGPAAGIGLAAILIPLGNGKLITEGPTSDDHPIHALRILLAADVIRAMPDLDANVANAWADGLESIVDNYITDKNDFRLYSKRLVGKYYEVTMPYEGMREIVKILAETIAFEPLDSLEGHFLSQINTWTNSDEELTSRIVNDFLDHKEPSLEPGPNDQIVYAAHVLSGAIIALTQSPDPDISKITELTIKSINKLYDADPVWSGFPIRFRSDIYQQKLVPNYRNIREILVHRSA